MDANPLAVQIAFIIVIGAALSAIIAAVRTGVRLWRLKRW